MDNFDPITCSYWSQELSRKSANKKPRLWMVFAKSFKWPFLLQSILSLLEVSAIKKVNVVYSTLFFPFIGGHVHCPVCYLGGAGGLLYNCSP